MMSSSCDIEHGPSDIRLNRDDPRVEYRIYRNIENGDSKCKPIRKCDEFERIHKIIIPKTTFTQAYYHELQKKFITLAITEGQSSAVLKILKQKK